MTDEHDTGIRLGFRTLPGETMRQTVERYAARYGLQYECLSFYDSEIQAGSSEANAALYALGEWDVLDLFANGDDVLDPVIKPGK